MIKKKILFGLVGSTLCLFVFIVILNLKYDNAVIIENEKSRTTVKNTNALTMMYETEANSGEYQVLDSDTWIQDGYIFNNELSRCENGGTLSWNDETNKVIMQTNSSDKCYVYFDVYSVKYFNEKILEDNPTTLTRTDFSAPLTNDNTKTIYKVSGNWTEDINGDGEGEVVYYFAGNALNNWVKFGKNENDEDLYWRIIRINEDNSVRLLYSGTSPSTIEGYISLNYYFMSSSDVKFVGYMFGESGTLDNNRLNTNNSNIKSVVDEWYGNTFMVKNDLEGNLFNNYVSKTAIYCNDRVRTTEMQSYGWYYYGAYNRLYDNKHPSYKCGNDFSGNLFDNYSYLDKFSVSTTYGGNGDLIYPVALITADEIAYAGGVYNIDAKAWYYYNSLGESIIGDNYWWTMSPSYGSYAGYARVFSMNNATLSDRNASSSAIRPVISLKSCVYWLSGDGSNSNTYEVYLDDNCSSVEN